MNSHKFSEKAWVTILVCYFVLMYGAVAKAEAIRIVIFPFQIHSAEDLDYLQGGLYDMLANRLGSADGSIQVIPREVIAEKISAVPSQSFTEKSHISQTLQADYFVSGSLMALGANISTDVQFYKVNQTAPLVKLSQTGNQGDVIAHINQFAVQVNQSVFDKSAQVPLSAEDSAPAQKPEAPIDGLSVVATDRQKTGRWQSSTYNSQLKCVTVGDVDGDGSHEIVLADKFRILVLRYRDNRIEEIARIELGKHANILAVDAADINANGKSEIFVTNYATLNEWPASLIYEYADNLLSVLAKDTKWFYRTQRDMDGKSILTAQKKLVNLGTSEKIQVLDFADGQYVVTDTIKPPRVFNIYDMAYVHNDQSDDGIFVGYDRNSEITAWSNKGRMLWESGESAGGSLNYIEYSDRYSVDKVRHYISKRILLADTDSNGRQEFIAIKNINSSPEWMTSARRYKRGYVTCLEWDASGALETKWKTEEERGYISDMALGDVTHDGKVDLVFTVVSDVKRKLEKSSSYLVVQQLP